MIFFWRCKQTALWDFLLELYPSKLLCGYDLYLWDFYWEVIEKTQDISTYTKFETTNKGAKNVSNLTASRLGNKLPNLEGRLDYANNIANLLALIL